MSVTKQRDMITGYPLGGLSLAALAPTYAYVYSMMLSNAILGLPLFDGALYLCGRCGDSFAALRKYSASAQSSPAVRWTSRIITIILMFLNILLLIIYPISTQDGRVWLLLVLMVTQYIRHTIGKRLQQNSVHLHTSRLCYAGLFLLSLCIAAWVLLYQLPASLAWKYLVGFGLVAMIEVFSISHNRTIEPPFPTDHAYEQSVTLRESLQQSGAFTQFEKIWALVVLALHVTLMLMYTYLVLTAEEVLICMLIATAATLIPVKLSSLLFSKKQNDPYKRIPWLLAGLFLWIYSISLYGQMIRQGAMTQSNAYLCLGLCSTGASFALGCVAALERNMEGVARFVSREHADAYVSMRQMVFQLASLIGEMLVLTVWTIVAFRADHGLPQNQAQLLASIHPWMLFPVLIMLSGAILSAIKFPMSGRMMEKLSRILHLEEEGHLNPALRHQVSDVVYASKLRPMLMGWLKAMLRPFFRAKLLHADRLQVNPDNPMVLLCNHGELYGPAVANLRLPIPVRSWAISEMVIDKEEVAQYIYRFTLQRQKWLPNPWKMPLARLIGPVSVWVMMQLENIPVYRNKPWELRETFRKTVEALEAGDNVLIFPENPDADENHRGYVQDGIGTFFSGFAVIAPLYFHKTGKRCRFVPMYVDKASGIMAFGEEILFNPDNDAAEERERIAHQSHNAMQNLREEVLQLR